MTVSEADNGREIQVALSTRLRLVLHSTSWQITGSSNPDVLAPQDAPTYEARRGECPPGAGCGAITQTFAAVAPGHAELMASRKACGEALPCRPDQQRFAVTIVVTAS